MGCGGSSEAKYAASYEAVTGSTAKATAKAAPAPKATEETGRPAASQASQASQASTEDGGATGAETPEEQPEEAPLAWWSIHTDWIRDSSHEILAAYNFFFEHIGIRKGWRTPPFKREDVQGPFMAAAEVVAVVRHRIDELGGGMVLRQLEGSSHDFLWGWSPEKVPNQAPHLMDFFRGLVFATMSDANGLVEGLDDATLDYYVQSHPILESSTVLERIVTEDVLKKGPPMEEAQEAEAKPAGPAEPAEPAGPAEPAEPKEAAQKTAVEEPETKEEAGEKQEVNKEPDVAEVKDSLKPTVSEPPAETDQAAAPLMLGNG